MKEMLQAMFVTLLLIKICWRQWTVCTLCVQTVKVVATYLLNAGEMKDHIADSSNITSARGAVW